MESTLPIACTLSDMELEQRRETLLLRVVEQAGEVRQLQNGYGFRFAAADAILEEILTLIRKERRCCRFLRFDLRVMPDEGPIWLDLTGPEGTEEFLKTTLHLPV